MERSPMPRSFLGTLAGQAKSAETKILSARCPASNCFVPDEDADLIIINYVGVELSQSLIKKGGKFYERGMSYE